MFGKIIGGIAGAKAANHVRGVNEPGGALLGIGAAALARRLGPVGLIAALAWFSSDISLRLENTTDISPVGYGLQLVAAAGIIGGFVYWLLAGRKAGLWKNPYAAT